MAKQVKKQAAKQSAAAVKEAAVSAKRHAAKEAAKQQQFRETEAKQAAKKPAVRKAAKGNSDGYNWDDYAGQYGKPTPTCIVHAIVQPGDAVEVVAKCKCPQHADDATAARECRFATKSWRIVRYVLNSGFSQKHDTDFTTFIPEPEPKPERAAKVKQGRVAVADEIAALRAENAAILQWIQGEMKAAKRR